MGYGRYEPFAGNADRYAIIDPIIRSLGWNTDNPKECYPEYPQWNSESPRQNHKINVDYAFFDRQASIFAINHYHAAPTIIIEAKALDEGLDDHVSQLKGYANAVPPMQLRIGVLTNGRVWRLYDFEQLGEFICKLIGITNIYPGPMDTPMMIDLYPDPAHFLYQWLRRER